MTQLRAQSRMHAGFPIEPAGKTGPGTAIRHKDTHFEEMIHIPLKFNSKTIIFVRLTQLRL